MEYLSARDCVVGGCNNIDSLCAMGDTSLSFGEVGLMALNKRRFDALIIGAGGAGLNAAVQFANTNARVAVVSKVFPTRSHTVAAQGGVNAALANVMPDNWHWHMFDTVKGSDYLGDQDSIEYMCREAIPTVYELEHNGVPFSRLDNGKIYQRAFGGQSQNFGGAQAARTCAAADRTGHAILHSLYQQNVRARTHFFDEYFAIDLIRDNEGAILGALVLEIETGEPLLIEAKATVLATGGCGQVFRTTSNAHINTGDGMAMALRAGVPLMDMEFYQFHPTGIAGKGMLITEGVRGEGGYLINKDGERFMERYAPNAKDLASRDVVSRAIVTEVKEGRGCGPNGDHVLLKLDHLGEEIIQKRLPGIRESGKIFAGVDAAVEPLPVFPTAHYIMGGIPTDRYGRVIVPHGSGEEVVPGLYAAGEAACVSVHGANRLGGNSLLDILVFGRAAGLHVLDNMEEHHRPMNEDSVDQAMQSLQRWDRKGDGLSVRELRDEFRKTMEDHAGVFRTEEIMSEGVEKIKELRKKMDDVVLTDHSKVFNTARIEALELQNLMDCGIALAASALARKESRGAHSRPDYPDRNDAEWMKHSLYYLEGDRIDFKPVQTKPLTVDSFPPKERVY
jgi:succinate dehydrogenase / fumarate reductase flavoprotein subunit